MSNAFLPTTARTILTLVVCVFSCSDLLADFLVSDNFGNQVVRFSDSGAPLGAFIAPGSGGLAGAVGMVIAPNGDLLVASQSTNQVLRYNGNSGAFVGVFAGTNLNGPSHLQFHSNGNLLVSNFNGNSVSEFSSSGTYLREFTSGSPGSGLQGVSSFTSDASGNYYVGSFNSGEIFRYDSTGAYQDTFASGFPGASGLRFIGGNLWVASLLSSSVAQLNPSGMLIGGFSTGEVSPGNGTFPSFILESPFGSNEVLIALTAAGGVYRYATNGSTGGPTNPFLIGNGLIVPGEILQVSSVPEPTALLGLGWVLMAAFGKRRRTK
jgi:hypothetical protein